MLSRGNRLVARFAQPLEDRSLGVRRESKAQFARALAEWRGLGKLDVHALRRIVAEYILVVPGDPAQPPLDLRVTGEYALAHPLNTLGLCLQVGKALGIGGSDLRLLGAASLVHDFGKEIPETYPGREALRMQGEHCGAGYELLTELAPDFPEQGARIARDHHERADGRGPLGKKNPSELAAIVALCDVYDARVTNHPFRGATSPHVSFHLTLTQADLFPAQVVEAFRAAVVPYPVGSRVFLADGRKGEVAEINRDCPTLPIVRIGATLRDLRAEPRSRVQDLVRTPTPRDSPGA